MSNSKKQYKKARDLCADYLHNLADTACSHEEQRNASLDNLSNYLLVCISLISVVFITPSIEILETLSRLYKQSVSSGVLITLLSIMAMVLLIGSFFLVLRSFKRKPGSGLSSPLEQAETLKEYINTMEVDRDKETDKLAVEIMYCEAVNDHFLGIKNKNDDVSRMLSYALKLISLSVVVAISAFLLTLLLLR